MDKWSLLTYTVFPGALALLSFLIGGWSTSLSVLAIFMSVDIIAGVIVSLKERKLSSKLAFNGFLKKATIMLIIIISNALDMLLGGTPIFKTMTIFFYIGMEGISIAESLGKVGVPIPKQLREKLQQLYDEEEKEK